MTLWESAGLRAFYLGVRTEQLWSVMTVLLRHYFRCAPSHFLGSWWLFLSVHEGGSTGPLLQ